MYKCVQMMRRHPEYTRIRCVYKGIYVYIHTIMYTPESKQHYVDYGDNTLLSVL